MMRSVKKWSFELEAMLQYCFASADWNMFWDYVDSVDKLTTSVTGFIRKCITNIVPTVKVCVLPIKSPGLAPRLALS